MYLIIAFDMRLTRRVPGAMIVFQFPKTIRPILPGNALQALEND